MLCDIFHFRGLAIAKYFQDQEDGYLLKQTESRTFSGDIEVDINKHLTLVIRTKVLFKLTVHGHGKKFQE